MNIKELSKASKQYLVAEIEQHLYPVLFPELLQDVKAATGLNAEATLGFAQEIGTVVAGVRYHPVLIKPLDPTKGTYLPLHKTQMSMFGEFLTKHRDTIAAFSTVRNMLLKATTVARSYGDLCRLTTIPMDTLRDRTDLQYTLSLSEIGEFQSDHKKAIDSVAYYTTYSHLFGDIQE
jgi:hypothetical protein